MLTLQSKPHLYLDWFHEEAVSICQSCSFSVSCFLPIHQSSLTAVRTVSISLPSEWGNLFQNRWILISLKITLISWVKFSNSLTVHPKWDQKNLDLNYEESWKKFKIRSKKYEWMNSVVYLRSMAIISMNKTTKLIKGHLMRYWNK